jgi:hypothetical protein
MHAVGKNDRKTKRREGNNRNMEAKKNYSPVTLTCGGDGVTILFTALNTLVDHSSSPFSSENAMLNLLRQWSDVQWLF